MKITAEQLSYLLRRKYRNIDPNTDYQIIETMREDPSSESGWVSNEDATIESWNLEGVKKPTEEDLERSWEILEPQFHSDPTHAESKLGMYLRNRKKQSVVVNEDL